MSWLLDVNLLLASRWMTHPLHSDAGLWINSLPEFHTSSIIELGFLRISLGPAYRATWEAAYESLEKLHGKAGYRFLMDDIDGTSSPRTNSRDTTDAHLVALARRHRLKLASFDELLIRQPWAAGIAENPLSARLYAPPVTD